MSGIEVVGLLVGMFPLVISAMEHYEDVKKSATVWWRIMREHRRDYYKLKYCQLAFSCQLELLLYPLLQDEVVDQRDYETLLAKAGGDSWLESRIDNELKVRLGERHATYIEVLEQLRETMDKLCKATKVDDPQFQGLLKERQTNSGVAAAGKQRRTLIIKANVQFQRKRLLYSLTEQKRKFLLKEVEDYIERLRRLLSDSDELSALPHRRRRTRGKSVIYGRKMLDFRIHADTIFQLIRDAWHSNCRSKACLLLQQNYAEAVEMKIHIRFCHSGRSMLIKLCERASTLQLPSRKILQSSSAEQPSTSGLQGEGLCQTFGSTLGYNACVGTLCGEAHDYEVYPFAQTVSMTARRSLADVLQPNSVLKLGFAQRYSIALTLASAHLYLHRSFWLSPIWSCEDILFPVLSAPGGTTALHGEPYILAAFDSNGATTPRPRKDCSFSTLGIVLLELFFGVRFESHYLWQEPLYASSRTDHTIRQIVACKWLDEVEDEAGEEYSSAVSWTLRQVPRIKDGKDDDWRADFAENVVQPLQRCYEFLNPSS